MTGIDFEYIRWARQAAEADHYLELMALFARQHHGAQTQVEHFQKEGNAVMEAMMQFWVERSLEQHDQCKRLYEKRTGKAADFPGFLSPPPAMPKARQSKRCPAASSALRLKRIAASAHSVQSGG